MRPSSVGGGRILRRTLSVCLSVRPSRARMYFVYICTVLRANIHNRKTSVFAYGSASRMYFSAREEGRNSPHIVRPSRPHKFCRATLQRSASLLPSFRLFDCMVNGASAQGAPTETRSIFPFHNRPVHICINSSAHHFLVIYIYSYAFLVIDSYSNIYTMVIA